MIISLTDANHKPIKLWYFDDRYKNHTVTITRQAIKEITAGLQTHHHAYLVVREDEA